MMKKFKTASLLALFTVFCSVASYSQESETKVVDEVVAQVSKKWFSWRETYGIDIQEGEDEVLLLACAVVIERSCHDEEEGHD